MTEDGKQNQSGRAALGWAHVAVVLIVMAALVAIVWLALGETDNAGEAAAVLGTVVPGLAAVGAAVFGIPIAYQSGKAGKEEAVEESRKTGVSDGKKEAAARVERLLPAPSALAAMGAENRDPFDEVRTELANLRVGT